MWAAHRAMSFIGRVVTMRCDPGAALRYLFPHMPQECEDQALTYSFSSLWTRQLWQRDSIRCYVVVEGGLSAIVSWCCCPVVCAFSIRKHTHACCVWVLFALCCCRSRILCFPPANSDPLFISSSRSSRSCFFTLRCQQRSTPRRRLTPSPAWVLRPTRT